MGGLQTEHCTDFDAHRNRKTTNTLSSNRARHTKPSVKPRQAKMKARNENTKQRGTLRSNTSVPPPKKRLPPKTYVWHDKLCNTLFFPHFQLLEELFPQPAVLVTHPQKKETRAKKEKEPPQSKEGTPSRHHSTIPAYIFFNK